MKKPTPTDFEPNDFVIRLRPHMEEDEWIGDVDISIMWDGSNDLSDSDFINFMHLTKMVCASVPLMEDNPKLKSDISDFVYGSYNDIGEGSDSPQRQPDIIDRQCNVVYLSFNTKTKGSA